MLILNLSADKFESECNFCMEFFPTISLISRTFFSRGGFFLGGFFPGGYFPGDFFMGGKFPGFFFPVGNFPGGIFPGGDFFPGEFFLEPLKLKVTFSAKQTCFQNTSIELPCIHVQYTNLNFF